MMAIKFLVQFYMIYVHMCYILNYMIKQIPFYTNPLISPICDFFRHDSACSNHTLRFWSKISDPVC